MPSQARHQASQAATQASLSKQPTQPPTKKLFENDVNVMCK